MKQVIKVAIAVFTFASLIIFSGKTMAQHPNLVITKEDVVAMRKAVNVPGRFATAYESEKQHVDALISQQTDVPVPVDGAGGYTHEKHKKNYQDMYRTGLIYQISQDERYGDFVRKMLLDYAELYPTLDVHPERKVNSQNPGKFFWQSLNEAMWLVYTIQAYDLVYDAIPADERKLIEDNLLKPVALFISEGQPSTFNKVHNHGTWATAGVGMSGYVMNQPEWVEKALYDLDKSGEGGFLKQLDILFSPDGYYNEGPYYQRFALLPFVTFASAIENNEPDRQIFAYRDHVLLKAINATIQLSYNGKFFPINDAIKSKGIDTIELVHGVAAAYQITGDTGLLDIAEKQGQILLTGAGLAVANALDAQKVTPYAFSSVAFGDGHDGKEGALVIMRESQENGAALLFKPASQGLGHGHFDKLTWQFYDHGAEIVTDYGAARFLNVEAKFGGRYLPENETYAKQTVAHNTVVVDERSHFNGDVDVANANAPELLLFDSSEAGTVSKATISAAYDDVSLSRTVALIPLPELEQTIALDIFEVAGKETHQFDLPLHYSGQLIETNFPVVVNPAQLSALGEASGYEHLWLKGSGKVTDDLAKVTWLNDNGVFYTQTSIAGKNETFLFTQTGANDPNFNLRNENAFIRRVKKSRNHKFVSVLEPHGEYNPSKEYTLGANSRVTGLAYTQDKDVTLINLAIAGHDYLIAINEAQPASSLSFQYKQQNFTLSGGLAVFLLDHQE